MQAEANIIVKYARADGYGKINIICNNYQNFLCLVDVHEKRIKREIVEEKKFNRQTEHGDLGIRVQTSRSISSPTENEAMDEWELDKAIKTGKVPKGLVMGTDDDAGHILELETLKVMRDDYAEFQNNLVTIKKRDKRIFMEYLESDRDLEELADDEEIQYHSMVQRLSKVKHTLVYQMGL